MSTRPFVLRGGACRTGIERIHATKQVLRRCDSKELRTTSHGYAPMLGAELHKILTRARVTLFAASAAPPAELSPRPHEWCLTLVAISPIASRSHIFAAKRNATSSVFFVEPRPRGLGTSPP